MRRCVAIVATSVALVFFSRSYGAQPASPELCRSGISCAASLWHEETFELKSAAGGAPYVIQISIPGDGAPPSGYPVVYLLDAGTTFGTLADIAHYQALFFTPVVVVGVRYPDVFEVDRRGDDLGSPAADSFLKFLVEDLRKEVSKRAKTDPSRQALFGHSLSGYFALRSVFTRPEAFDTYVIGDPSIGLGDWRIVKQVDALKDRKFSVLPRRLLLTRGTDEGQEVWRFAKKAGIPPPKPALPGGNEVKLAHFAVMLRGIEGLNVTYVEFPGETHQSMIPAHLGRGMRWTLLGWDPP
jgi:uncharacterized protein